MRTNEAPLGPSIAEAVPGTQYALAYWNPRTNALALGRVEAMPLNEGEARPTGTAKVKLVRGFGTYGFVTYHGDSVNSYGTQVAIADLHEWTPELEAWAEAWAEHSEALRSIVEALRDRHGMSSYSTSEHVTIQLDREAAERLVATLDSSLAVAAD